MSDIFIRFITLPAKIHGFVMEDPAGDYNVYIRSEDAPEVQQRTLRHELRHVDLGHLDNDVLSVREKEREALYD